MQLQLLEKIVSDATRSCLCSLLTILVFQILRTNSESVSIVQDLRESLKPQDFEKIHAVTCVSWGQGEYRRHIGMATSGGQILLYNIDKQTADSPPKSALHLQDSNRAVNSLIFSPTNNSVMLSASGDGGVRLWDLRTDRRKPSLTFTKQGDMAREVQCSPFDGAKFAAIYDSGTIQRWDIRNPTTCDRRINAHSGTGLSIDWHPEYDYIVSGGRDKQIQIWNMTTESRKPDRVILSPSAVSKVRWQFDLQHSTASSSLGVLNTDIVSCNMSLYDYGIYVWNPQRPYIPRYVVEEHTNVVTDVFWRSNNILWSISKDKTFRQHNISGRQMAITDMPAQALSWNHENNLSFVVQDKHEEQYVQLVDEDIPVVQTDAKRRASVSGLKLPLAPVAVPSGAPVNQAICTVAFPGFNADSFQFCAQNYLFYDTGQALGGVNASSSPDRIIDICLHNSLIASHAGQFRTAQTWRVLLEIISCEKEEFSKFSPTKQPVLGSLQPFASRITESLKGLSSAEGTPLLRPLDDSGPSSANRSRDASTERARGGKSSGSKAITGNINITPQVSETTFVEEPIKNTKSPESRPADGTRQTSVSNSESDERDFIASSFETDSPDANYQSSIKQGSGFTQLTSKTSSEHHSGKTDAHGTKAANLKEGTATISNTSSRINVSSAVHTVTFDSEERKGFDALSVPGKASLGKSILAPPSASRPVPGKGYHSGGFQDSRLSVVEEILDSTDKLSISSFIPPNSPAFSRQNEDPSSSEISSPEVFKKVEPKPSVMTLDSAPLIAPPGSASLGSNLYREYLQTLTHPWRAEKMIEQASRYSMEQGDVQMCAILGMLFMKDYPGAFESQQMLEEWTWAYMTLLRRYELHIVCAEIIKLSPFESVREMGQIETSLDILCHRCSHPLTDNTAAALEGNGRLPTSQIAFWYCAHCRKLLEGCIFCGIPVKGIAVAIFECGHTLHPECLDYWKEALEMQFLHSSSQDAGSLEGLIECPSGCQTIIVNQL